MSIYKSAVNNPIKTTLVFVAILIFGLYSLSRLPIDFYPKMDLPMISVVTTYSGANAADVETNVTKPLEDALNSIQGLKELTSTSQDNSSIITLQFEWGVNLDESMNDIRGAIDMALSRLPDGVERPSVVKFSTSSMPILMYSVTAKESYPGLSKLITEKIINPLNRVDGIGSASMTGDPKRKIYIDIDPNRLDAYHLSLEQIGSAIQAENLNMPSGNIKMGATDYQLRVEGEFKESEQVKNIVVGTSAGTPVFLRDVAQVRDTLKDVTLDQKTNGQNSIQLYVMKRSGANTVSVGRDVKKMLEEIKPTLPPDVQIHEVFDSSTFIKGSVSNLSDTLLFALLFVATVVFFFLGRWRATIIILLTIPISLVSALIYLAVTDNSLNIISLASMSMAIGMVVDDAIVVLENITKHIERGSSPREAAIYATNEVWLAVIMATLVVVAVFMPLTFVSGITGVIFNQLGWIVSITVVVSTVAAVTITPMLAARFMKVREKKENPKKYSYDATIGKWLDNLDIWYEKVLHWALEHKLRVILVSAGIFIGSLCLTPWVATDFMSQNDESRLTIKAELAPGTRMEISSETARKIEKVLQQKVPEIELISTSCGADDQGGMSSIFLGSASSNTINMTLRLKDIEKRKRSDVEISESIRPELAKFPEIVNYQITRSDLATGSSTFDIEVYGYDFASTNILAQQIKKSVTGLKGVRDVQITRKDDRPELEVVLDREKLALNGLNSATVSNAIHNRINGMTASKFREDGDEFDIIVRLQEQYRNSVNMLEEVSVPTPSGKFVKLKEIGAVKEFWSPPNIDHKRKQRIVTVSITPVDVSLTDLAADVKGQLAKMNVPSDVQIVLAGIYKDQQESYQNLGLLALLVLLLVFIVMASQFESFSKPFAIMFSIPFAFTGVILALLLTGTTLSVVALLGAVLLIGIVVKNGIVLIDFINLLRDRGMPLNEAIAVGGRSRLRPVLMTASATFLGMVPMALSVGDGAETWTPMGITVIGGLIFSTVITMIIVPVMYALFSRRGERDKEGLVRKQFHFMDENNQQ
jgi:HAE1 family hydrophobic/amphiphilic exporter-1